MVNLKKYNGVLKLFVIFLTFFLILSCASTPYSVTKIEGKRLPITDKYTSTPSIEPGHSLLKTFKSRFKDLCL